MTSFGLVAKIIIFFKGTVILMLFQLKLTEMGGVLLI